MASRIRRKPHITYKSPSAEDNIIIILPLSGQRKPVAVEELDPKPSRSMQASRTCDATHRINPMVSSLPLFHPFGPLAMSLPPLDPTQYGLPVCSIPDGTERPSTRMRRAAKLREAENEVRDVSPNVSTVAAIAAHEAKDRANPRKRRAGGPKRKRKDAEDGDATYPAKRTRIPRGTVGQTAEDDVPIDLAQTPDGGTNLPEVYSDLNDPSKRRSTRARGSHHRRNSSASESTSISVSANPVPEQGETETMVPLSTDVVQGLAVTDHSSIVNRDKEKEEGELSEDLNS